MKEVTIKATGNQAPYGIGETIAVIPARHINKIRAIMSKYYNPPTLHIDGKRVYLRPDMADYQLTGKQGKTRLTSDPEGYNAI